MKRGLFKSILVFMLVLSFLAIPPYYNTSFASNDEEQAVDSALKEKGRAGNTYMVNKDGTIYEVSSSNNKTHIKNRYRKPGKGIYEKAAGQELVEKRDEFSKQYLNEDGTITAYVSGAPIHYNDGSGYKDIDLGISNEASGEYEYSCTKNIFEAYFNSSGSIDQGKLARFVLKNSKGTARSVEYILRDATPKSEMVDENSFRYSEIYENVDLEYILDSDKLKENIIIKAPVESFKYSFLLNIDGADIVKRDDGGIDFMDRDTGEKLWEIAPPIAEDSSDEIRKTTKVNYEIGKLEVEGKEYIEVTVCLYDIEFMESASYPVIIDPTTTLYRSYGRHIGPNGFAQSDSVYGYAYAGFPYGNLYEEFRVFLNFNVSSIPTNAVINSASLTIIPAGYLGTGVYSGTYLVKRLTSDATYATWDSQPSTSTSNQVSINTSYSNTKVWDITAMMQEIWSNAYPFYGFSLTAYPAHNYVFWYDSGNYPSLSINYTPNTAPAVTPVTPSNNAVYSENDTSVVPSMSVYDAENNTLTCKYYIDSETTPRDTKTATNTSSTPTVTFAAFNPSLLSEGTHTIRYTAYDGMATTTQTRSIKVDKTAPTITTFNTSSTENSITITASATDAVSGLHATPYRYIVGSTDSDWGSNTTYSKNSLNPNTTYSVTLRVRDAKEHIATSTRNVTTKAQIPGLAIGNPTATTLELSVSDNNPSSTEYQFKSGSNYVSSTGALTTTPSWVTLTGKKITVTGLTPETTYTFQAKARNSANEETDFCSSAQGITTEDLPAVPENIDSIETANIITITWDAVDGATGYYIEVDGEVKDAGTNTSYTHSGLTPNSIHNYRVCARNNNGNGEWSTVYATSTTNNQYTVNCYTDATFNLVLKASDIGSFNSHSFTVTYNANDFDLVDLCFFTRNKELTTGSINGTDITITQLSPGSITFTVNKSVTSGTFWSGVINIIQFKCKTTGMKNITYSMQ